MTPSESIAVGLCPGCIGTGRVERVVPYEDTFPCSTCGGSGKFRPRAVPPEKPPAPKDEK